MELHPIRPLKILFQIIVLHTRFEGSPKTAFEVGRFQCVVSPRVASVEKLIFSIGFEKASLESVHDELGQPLIFFPADRNANASFIFD